jgi:hypothetical protein
MSSRHVWDVLSAEKGWVVRFCKFCGTEIRHRTDEGYTTGRCTPPPTTKDHVSDATTVALWMIPAVYPPRRRGG